MTFMTYFFITSSSAAAPKEPLFLCLKNPLNSFQTNSHCPVSFSLNSDVHLTGRGDAIKIHHLYSAGEDISRSRVDFCHFHGQNITSPPLNTKRLRNAAREDGRTCEHLRGNLFPVTRKTRGWTTSPDCQTDT